MKFRKLLWLFILPFLVACGLTAGSGETSESSTASDKTTRQQAQVKLMI
ncbi:hypothetical protein [Aerococcus urinaeequi]|nr:hypothetical protein [Aerococcus urinaeequi]MDT2760953.1 hypothetical protein [Aerococcus urinaeequi]